MAQQVRFAELGLLYQGGRYRAGLAGDRGSGRPDDHIGRSREHSDLGARRDASARARAALLVRQQSP